MLSLTILSNPIFSCQQKTPVSFHIMASCYHKNVEVSTTNNRVLSFILCIIRLHSWVGSEVCLLTLTKNSLQKTTVYMSSPFFCFSLSSVSGLVAITSNKVFKILLRSLAQFVCSWSATPQDFEKTDKPLLDYYTSLKKSI